MGAIRELIVKIAFAFDGKGKKQADAAVNSTKRNMSSMASEAVRAGARMARSFLQSIPGANAAIHAIQRIKSSLSSIRGVNIKPNINGIASGMEGIGGTTSSLIGKFKALGAAIVAAFAVRGAIQTADEMMNLDGRLRTLYEDEKTRMGVENRLYSMSQQNRQGLAEMGNLYFKVARAGKQYGMGMDEAARVTDIVAKSLTIGGASAQEAQSTVLQLGQALGSGVLQGDELRSLDENASLLMQHIAESMGVTIGDLKAMGKDGVLTTEAVIKAILASGNAVDKEFGKMPTTFGQATTKLENFWRRFVWYVQSSTGVFGWVAQKISSMVDLADTVMTLATGPQQGATPEETAANQAKYDQTVAENPQLVAIASGVRQVMSALQGVWQYIVDVFTPAIDMIKDHWNAIVAAFAPGIEFLKTGVEDWGQAFESVKPILQTIIQIIGSAIVGALFIMFNVGSAVFRGISFLVKGLASLLSGVYDLIVSIADGISGLISKAKEFFGLSGNFDTGGAGGWSPNVVNIHNNSNQVNHFGDGYSFEQQGDVASAIYPLPYD